jgi:hypothetical protein
MHIATYLKIYSITIPVWAYWDGNYGLIYLKGVNMKRFVIYPIAFILVAFALSCASPGTRITASWKNPDISTISPANGSHSVFIAALIRNMELRTKLENSLAYAAEKRDIKTVKSTTVFAPSFYNDLPSQDQLMSVMGRVDADAILTVSLINKESETRYVPGSGYGYAPYPRFGWYGGFYRYYNYWYPIIWNPGYYVIDKTYYLETNLYNAKNDSLIWSAQSETVNPTSIDLFVRDYPKKLVKQMIKDGLLSK